MIASYSLGYIRQYPLIICQKSEWVLDWDFAFNEVAQTKVSFYIHCDIRNKCTCLLLSSLDNKNLDR